MSIARLALEKQLNKLRERFVRGLPDRVIAIQSALKKEDAHADVERLFHSLAGTAATYKLDEISSIAREGEDLCRDAFDTAQLTEILGRLRDASTTEVLLPILGDGGRREEGVLLRTALLAGNTSLAARLQREGFSIISAPTLADARTALAQRTPDVVVAAVDLPDGHASDVIASLRATPGGDATLAFVLGTPRTFIERIRMLHCGADGAFSDVNDIDTIAQTISAAHATAPLSSARILCVEDDPEYVAWVRAVLTGAGYEFLAVSEPSLLEITLASFQPDLLLLDVVLPDISGVELARYVRHMPSHAMLPIVFLTGTDAQRIDGLRAGGDDYLLKPVTPELLLTTVASRLKRSRVVQTLIDRDGLTGLLTHSAFAQRMRVAVAEAKRSRDAFAIVMMDIDHFKSINDRYGHLIGDHVLSSFGSFLRRSLRVTDSAARYGGEEFAVLLRGSDREDAHRLVQRLLEEFERVEHHASDGSSFRVTFSAGVAVLDARVEVDESVRRADGALYAAKEGGRARVKIAA